MTNPDGKERLGGSCAQRRGAGLGSSARSACGKRGDSRRRQKRCEDRARRRSRGRATGRAEAARSAGGPRGVAEAGDVGAALRKMRGHKPDVLELDVNMPGGPSLEAIPNFLEASPRTANVVLPMEDRPQFARAALRAGHWRSCSRMRPTPSMRTPCLPRLPATRTSTRDSEHASRPNRRRRPGAVDGL